MVTGKLAIVTGGARGIGAGIARVLASQGARVAILDLDLAEAEKTAASLPVPGIAVACDVADEHEAAKAVQIVVERLGGLDIVVNNAGVGRGPTIRPTRPAAGGCGGRHVGGRVGRLPVAESAHDVRDHQVGAAPSQDARRWRDRQHRLDRGPGGSPRLPAYAAAKAGVISLTKSLALEYAPHDIRVNVICPGFLWTRAWEGLARRIKLSVPEYAALDERAVFLEVVKRGVPLGREQTPEDIGHLVAFLASDAARNITGQWIAVDGGITLRQAN